MKYDMNLTIDESPVAVVGSLQYFVNKLHIMESMNSRVLKTKEYCTQVKRARDIMDMAV